MTQQDAARSMIVNYLGSLTLQGIEQMVQIQALQAQIQAHKQELQMDRQEGGAQQTADAPSSE